MFAALSLALTAREPAWMDRLLAGYALKYDQKHSVTGIHDPKSGFYLIRDVECDGGVLIVTLTRDRNIVTGNGYKVVGFVPKTHDNGSLQLVEKALPNLSTGKGIAIGASTSRVRSRLGRPTKIGHSGARRQWLDWTYIWINKKEDVKYTERYTFKANKLIEVEFSRLANDLPGN